MEIKTEFENGDNIPEKFTADGENVNPMIEVVGLPEDAKSLVLVVDDPDAQRVVGYTWVHWVVFDIPVENQKVVIEENSVPGKAGKSTYEKREYGGPNPPAGSGIHNYHFKFYVLDCFLELDEMTSLDEIEKSMEGYILEEKEIVGKYGRD